MFPSRKFLLRLILWEILFILLTNNKPLHGVFVITLVFPLCSTFISPKCGHCLLTLLLLLFPQLLPSDLLLKSYVLPLPLHLKLLLPFGNEPRPLSQQKRPVECRQYSLFSAVMVVEWDIYVRDVVKVG